MALVSRPSARQRAQSRDPGATRRVAYKSIGRFALISLGPGSRSARANALAPLARDTRARRAVISPRAAGGGGAVVVAPEALVAADEAAGGDAHALLVVGNGVADHLRAAAVTREDREGGAGVGGVDHVAEA